MFTKFCGVTWINVLLPPQRSKQVPINRWGKMYLLLTYVAILIGHRFSLKSITSFTIMILICQIFCGTHWRPKHLSIWLDSLLGLPAFSSYDTDDTWMCLACSIENSWTCWSFTHALYVRTPGIHVSALLEIFWQHIKQVVLIFNSACNFTVTLLILAGTLSLPELQTFRTVV